MRSTDARAARRSLDARVSHLPQSLRAPAPRSGWVRTVRNALGMSAADLGSRLGVTPATISDMERSEAAHRIRLDTLERAADAMGCDVVYSFVPRTGSFADIVQRQARAKVAEQTEAVLRTMDLESQGATIDQEVLDEEVRRVIASGRLWK